jgi:hypothetical protein
MKLKHPVFMTFVFVVVSAFYGGAAHSQDEVQPTNDLPNPYETIAPWGNSLRVEAGVH